MELRANVRKGVAEEAGQLVEAVDRVLDLPTNEAWINPWVRKLKSMGVTFVGGRRLSRYEVSGGKVRAAWVQDRAGNKTRITADWFVSAMPVEQARKYVSSDLLKIDPALAGLSRLKTDWMTGIQFFLREEINLVKGHITFIDSPWALTALTQAQFFKALQACLERLPARTGQVFMMREHLGLETGEICKEVGITPTHCWVLLYRARMVLRECLQQTWFGR